MHKEKGEKKKKIVADETKWIKLITRLMSPISKYGMLQLVWVFFLAQVSPQVTALNGFSFFIFWCVSLTSVDKTRGVSKIKVKQQGCVKTERITKSNAQTNIEPTTHVYFWIFHEQVWVRGGILFWFSEFSLFFGNFSYFKIHRIPPRRKVSWFNVKNRR